MQIFEQQTVDEIWAKGEAPVTCIDLFAQAKMTPAFRYAGRVRPPVPVDGSDEEFFIFGYVYVHNRSVKAAYRKLKVNGARPTPATKCPAHPNLYEVMETFDQELGLDLREPVTLSFDDLVVTDEELLRVSRELGLEVPDEIAVGEDTELPLATRERNNLLKLSGVLASMYIQLKPARRLGTPDAPAIAQLIREIHEHLNEHYIADRGLSERLLNDRLQEAFAYLNL